ncbi:MAG: hypothetical protein Aurels2KO_37990 [Aureliella sp.]
MFREALRPGTRPALRETGLTLLLCLAVSLAPTATCASDNSVTSTTKLHRPLPESLTSFGACVLDEYLYVFSGHSGVAHGFGRDLLVDHFRRIKFDDPAAEWEELAMHKPAQSVAIVTDGEFIYRVGGLTFHNSGDDSQDDFDSTTHFARYDVDADEWTELADLPVGRSSLDAAVVGRSIYVAGGWNLKGTSSRKAPWHEDILRFDLDDPAAGWQSIDGPGYLTRAVSTAAFEGKFYVFGGIQQRGITRKVSCFDHESGRWSEAPELPADNSAAGFATSSFAVGGRLYVTGASGVVYALSNDKTQWEVVNRLMFPRMFLRLLPVGESRVIALGGTGAMGRTAVVESVDLSIKPTTNLVRWSTEFGGRAKHSQSLVLDGGKLYAFGGNASRESHDFSNDAFVDEAFVFDLGSQSCKSLPKVPTPMQSGAVWINAQTSEHKTFVVAGGMAPGKDGMQYLDTSFAFDPEENTWETLPNQLPEPLAMFSSVVHDSAAWLFGGSGGQDVGLATTVLHWWGDASAIAPLYELEIPHPRRSFGGAALNGKYYMVGGLGEGMSICEDVDVFDFDSRSWASIAPPSVPRVFPSLVEANGQLYLYGGFTNQTGHFAPAESLEVYDPELNKWTTVASSLPGVRPSMSMHAFNDRLLFYGIDESEDGVANFVMYDPAPLTTPKLIEGNGFGGRRSRDETAETAKMMIRKDTNKDGKLSTEELGSRMAALVADGDSNSDGLLSMLELKEVLKQQVEADKAEAEVIEAKAKQAGSNENGEKSASGDAKK